MGRDGAPQGLAARLQRREARQQGLLDDIGASAGAGLLKAIPLAPQVGLDVIQARDEALPIEQGPGRGKPRPRARQLTVAGEELRVDPVGLAEDANAFDEAAHLRRIDDRHPDPERREPVGHRLVVGRGGLEDHVSVGRGRTRDLPSSRSRPIRLPPRRCGRISGPGTCRPRWPGPRSPACPSTRRCRETPWRSPNAQCPRAPIHLVGAGSSRKGSLRYRPISARARWRAGCAIYVAGSRSHVSFGLTRPHASGATRGGHQIQGLVELDGARKPVALGSHHRSPQLLQHRPGLRSRLLGPVRASTSRGSGEAEHAGEACGGLLIAGGDGTPFLEPGPGAARCGCGWHR